jgi:ubiquitin-protein ligase E3 C
MGDDEFFSDLNSPARTNSTRNTLTLDEITSLSRKLLNITFTLFWRETQVGAKNLNGRIPGLNVTWESVRRLFTRFLQAVYAREYELYLLRIYPSTYLRLCSSRRPFTPSDHWLANEHIDVGSLIEAAM